MVKLCFLQGISILPWIGEDDFSHGDFIHIPFCFQWKIKIEIVPNLLKIHLLSNLILPCVIGGHGKCPASEFFIEACQVCESAFGGLEKIKPLVNDSILPHAIFL